MNILIVEDELILAYAMEGMLKSMGHPTIQIEPDFDKAQLMLLKNEIDLALLDINLGKGEEGIELANICKQRKIPFLFVSSYTDKATLDKAIETNPGAYLIKPISEGNLYTTVQIVLNQYRNKPIPILEFKDGTELIKLPLNEVLYLKSENIYVNVVTHQKTFLYRGSLASLIEKVPEGSLIQTHRAYAVNPDCVTRLSSNYAVINQIEIPISRNFKNQLNKG